MALRDTWHRTLVYFGLAEEEDPRYEPVREPEPEAEIEDRYRERPNVRRLQRRRRDEIDDIFADEPRGFAVVRAAARRPDAGRGRDRPRPPATDAAAQAEGGRVPPRQRRPDTLPPRWAAVVADALDARRRWADLLAGMRPARCGTGWAELGCARRRRAPAVWETAVRAVEAGRIVEALDVEEVTREYKRAKADPAADPALVEALSARFTSVQRVLNTIDDAEQRLRLLDARLGAAVARAAEVALAAGEGGDALGAELEAVVSELGALRPVAWTPLGLACDPQSKSKMSSRNDRRLRRLSYRIPAGRPVVLAPVAVVAAGRPGAGAADRRRRRVRRGR